MAKVLQRLDILLFANTAQYRSEMRDTQQSTTTMFGAIKADAANMAKVGAAAFAGMAVAGTAAIGVMIKEQVELAGEITKLAKISNTGVESMQKLAIAAKAVGVEQDTLGDIYKDTQDKIGDFLSTGGGAMADFFDNIAPQIGVTAEQFRELSGPDALQLYYNGLQEANLSQSELVFYMEAIASDASALIPLLHDAGAGFDVWAQAAENAGAVMDEETIRATQELQSANDLMMLSYDGAKKQFTTAFIPVLADVANQLVGSSDAADIARESGEYLVQTFKVMAATGLGVVTVVKAIGKSIGGMGAILAQWGNITDGVDFSSPFAFFQLAKNAVYDIPKSQIAILGDVLSDITSDFAAANRQMDAIYALGTGSRNSNQYIDAATNQRKLSTAVGVTGQAYQAQQSAAESAAKAIDKHSAAIKNAQKVAGKAPVLTINSKVKANAERYGFAALEAQNGLPYGLLSGIHQQESSGNTRAVGPNTKYGTAKGGFQFIDPTAKQYAVKDPFNMEQAAIGAAKYLKFLLDKFNGNVAKAVAAYNTGEGNVDKYDLSLILSDRWARNKKTGVGQTKEYVQNVLAYTQSVRSAMGESSQFIYDSLSQETASIEKAAAEQARIAEQQSNQRNAIRLDSANQATRIEMQLAEKIDKINASGFNEDERLAFVADAQQRAAIELANFEDTQAKKIAALSSFAQSERDLIAQTAIYEATAILRDEDLNQAQRDQALDYIKQKAEYQINQLDLVHDQQMQYATQAEQTDSERIRNQYALERREIQLTINMDEQLRKAKIDALNQAEQMALSERRYAYESELRQLTSFGQSDLAALRADYADQRRILDNRTDIDPSQISELRNASKGRELKETRDLQKNALDGFNAQNYDMSGIGANYGLAQQYQQRLKVIEDAVKAEVIAVEQAEQAKYNSRLAFESAATQLTLSTNEAMIGSLAGSLKTMLGEQNAGYQLLFAGQQAFVMASAGLNMYEAWGDAMAEGATLSQKFASAAVIATEFGRIITAASSMTLELPGYQVGGFTASGGDSDPVGLVHANEFVANAPTTRKYRPELEAMHNGTYDRSASNTSNVNVNVTVNSNGSSSVESDQKMGRDLGNVISAAVTQQLNKERRQGGMLYGR